MSPEEPDDDPSQPIRQLKFMPNFIHVRAEGMPGEPEHACIPIGVTTSKRSITLDCVVNGDKVKKLDVTVKLFSLAAAYAVSDFWAQVSHCHIAIIHNQALPKLTISIMMYNLGAQPQG